METLKKKWAPVFVRDGEKVPEGNRALMREGGLSLDLNAAPADVDFMEWLRGRIGECRNDETGGYVQESMWP